MPRNLSALALLLSLLISKAVADDAPPFAAVRAILSEKCLACHGNDPKDLKGKYELRTREAALRGGESGEPAIIPGQPDKSPLVRAITWTDDALQMPPKENDRLSESQVEVIRRWIAAGAKWDDVAAKPGAWSAESGIRVTTSGGRLPEWDARTYDPEAIWAYRPIQAPPIPQNFKSQLPNPIDAFLRAKQIERGITEIALPADARTLLRRASFDLTGLPPSVAPSLISSVNDKGVTEKQREGEAYEETLDRLLASPHYGERQAQHWFDVVRYADTAGFSNDFERPHAWRYRDFVIRSFNADKPYDQFLREQIAGDELEPDDPEMLIAAGYLRLGPWEHTGMTVAAVTRQQFLDDVTHHVGVSVLAQGLRCAACHDHKFDPVPTKDYYRMQAIFAPVQFAERPAEFLKSEDTSGFESARALVQTRLDQVQAALAALKQKNQDAVAAYLAERGVKSLDELPPDQRPKQDYLGGTFGLTKTDLSLRKIYQKSQAYLERELKRFEPFAMSVYSGPPNGYTSIKPLYDLPTKREGEVQLVSILSGGSLESPAEVVTPGILSAMVAMHTPSSVEVGQDIAGRRVALAGWITSRENTLTARVIVNRVWQQHFGRGLVATPNSFGKMGSRPTHPELLDWLAAWLIENEWSLKKLHKLIMTSATYQQSSDHPAYAKLAEIDPKNELLAYFPPRRLSAEEVRDAQLAASGELNRQAGGPGVFPEINWEVALQPRHIMGSVPPAYVPSLTRAQRNRRTIYAFRIRTLADPMLEVLNRPGSETSCERRDETTTAPQAFSLFNSEASTNRALAMATRLQKEHATVNDQIAAAFHLLYGRPATTDEIARCSEHLARMTSHQEQHAPVPTELPKTVRRGMVEELTGEMVYWDEDLSVLNDYERDLMPWQVEPRTRALADLCLVLMNSNEFLYVR